MLLSPGARLGPYEILSLAGAGGMGEVYKAKDTRLDRIVAIKVLPGHFVGNTASRQRFEREARAVSSLNHPHICTLHDVGYQDGVDFLVMEYLEGETLAQRLRKGPLPLDQLLKTGIEIASALDAAHRKGIVHRDLKPGNIMLVKAGAKVLDFGVAKVAASVTGVSSLTAAPTVTSPLTAEGAILGTLPYLAPEQLEGKKADARTDLFVFGTVLYEMVTGRKAFEGESQASLIAAILSSEPRPLSELEPMTPPALVRLVRKCLAKDPDARWQTARDLADEMKWIAQAGSLTSTTSPAETRRRGREWLAWLVTGLSLTLATVVTVTYRHRTPPPARPIRAVVNAPEEAPFNFTGDFGAPPGIFTRR